MLKIKVQNKFEKGDNLVDNELAIFPHSFAISTSPDMTYMRSLRQASFGINYDGKTPSLGNVSGKSPK